MTGRTGYSILLCLFKRNISDHLLTFSSVTAGWSLYLEGSKGRTSIEKKFEEIDKIVFMKTGAKILGVVVITKENQILHLICGHVEK